MVNAIEYSTGVQTAALDGNVGTPLPVNVESTVSGLRDAMDEHHQSIESKLDRLLGGFERFEQRVEASFRSDLDQFKHELGSKIDQAKHDLYSRIDQAERGLNSRIGLMERGLNSRIDQAGRGCNSRIELESDFNHNRAQLRRLEYLVAKNSNDTARLYNRLLPYPLPEGVEYRELWFIDDTSGQYLASCPSEAGLGRPYPLPRLTSLDVIAALSPVETALYFEGFFPAHEGELPTSAVMRYRIAKHIAAPAHRHGQLSGAIPTQSHS
ncbi:hypothetical protein DL93DRAFT_1864888 [Clavulina sp. PMI_390]|nr:hypothetical protein DL93DRAFT_1864888 [Clavulina sp. PMI_390]